MSNRVGLPLVVVAAFSLGFAASEVAAQQALAIPEAEETGPQTIEDLLGNLAEEEAPPVWQEADDVLRPRPDQSRSFAVLSALDKITASVTTLAVGVGDTADFGTLSITVRSCQSTAADRSDANAVFLEIRDVPPGESPDDVFGGWMFSAARSVATMEHPVYDLWLVDCVDEVPQPPEDMARDASYGLPGNPPLPAPTPSRRL
ncbi:MAG: DUF2155 domain-containing protein [Pseudomonadota bacterium]